MGRLEEAEDGRGNWDETQGGGNRERGASLSFSLSLSLSLDPYKLQFHRQDIEIVKDQLFSSLQRIVLQITNCIYPLW
jgi:hypothetical protein